MPKSFGQLLISSVITCIEREIYRYILLYKIEKITHTKNKNINILKNKSHKN